MIGVAFAVRGLPAARPTSRERAAPRSGPRRAKGARGALAAWLEPRTLLIGLVVLAAALTEGSANDWVSLAVVDGFDVPHALGAVAFAIFVTAMTAMRWFGTTLLDRYGRVAVLRLCGGALARRPAHLRASPATCGSRSSASWPGARAPRSASRSA